MIRRFGMAALVATAGVGAASAQEVRIAVVATADVHGRVMHWDYVADREGRWGLTRAATVIDSLRRLTPDGLILVDAGDLYQGDPFALRYSVLDDREGHPVTDALNALRYDAFSPGPHDFDFGYRALRVALDGAVFATVAGNLRDGERNEPAFDPTALLVRGGVRVGISGFTMPEVMTWNRGGNIRVDPIVASAQDAMGALVDAGVQLRVALVHGALRSAHGADRAADLAALPDHPHLVVTSHSEAAFADSAVGDMHLMQPPPRAQGLAVAWITMSPNESGGFEVREIRSEIVSVESARPDPGVARRLDGAHRTVRAWANEPVADLARAWSGRFGRADDTPLYDFINEVQRSTAGAQLSTTPVFDVEVALPAGVVRQRDVFGLYPHEHTLRAVAIDGATLRDYLEQTTRYFRTFESGQSALNPAVPGDAFDVVRGVEYAIDLRQPPGRRIRQLTFNGSLVRPTDTLTMAVNDFRQVGSAGYAMLAGLPVVYNRGERIRDLLLAAVTDGALLDSAMVFDASWRILPAEARAAVRAAFGDTPVAAETGLALRVLATGNLRGTLEGSVTAWSQGHPVGGVGAVAATLDSLADACQCLTIRVDAGDQLQGDIVSNAFYGRPVVDLLGILGFSATVVGDRDLTWGADTLRARVTQSRFPWLAANVHTADRQARPDWLEEWTMVRRDGRRIAVVGVTTPAAWEPVHPSNRGGLVLSDATAAVRRVLRGVRIAEPHFVIVVVHGGGECGEPGCTHGPRDVARQLDRGSVDLIVGAGGDTVVNTVINDIPVVEMGVRGERVAVVDFITREQGGREVVTDVATVWADARDSLTAPWTQLLAAYQDSAEEVVGRVVGRARAPMSPQPEPEFPLGRFVADAYRNAVRTQLAVVPTHTILGGLAAGPIAYGDLYRVQAGLNTLVEVTVSGDSLYAAIEHAVRDGAPTVHISGFTVEYDPDRRVGDRVRRLRLESGDEIRRNREYTVATTEEMAGGAFGFSMFTGAAVAPTGILDVDGLASYIQRMPQPVAGPTTARFRIDD